MTKSAVLHITEWFIVTDIKRASFNESRLYQQSVLRNPFIITISLLKSVESDQLAYAAKIRLF